MLPKLSFLGHNPEYYVSSEVVDELMVQDGEPGPCFNSLACIALYPLNGKISNNTSLCKYCYLPH